MNVSELERRIKKIEARNKNVEVDKAWETSTFRKVVLLITTYFVIGLYMNYIKVFEPWMNAVVPSVGFLLSTLSLPFFKRYWTRLKSKQ